MKFMSVATSSANPTWRPFAKKRKQKKMADNETSRVNNGKMGTVKH